MKFLVTGGTGFIGSNLVDFLVKEGHFVEVWDNFIKLENLNKNAFLRICDVSSEIDDSYLSNWDVIFHLAAISNIYQSFLFPVDTNKSNIDGTINILEVAKKTGSKVIYAGSSTVYFDKLANPYAFTKYVGEEYCKMYSKIWDVPIAIARLFNVYGRRHRKLDPAPVIASFENQIIGNRRLKIYGDGSKRRDFTHVDDVVRGLYLISQNECKGEIFNFGKGKNYSIKEVALMFSDESNIQYLQERSGEATSTLANIYDTTDKLDWIPKHDLVTYINQFLDRLKVAKTKYSSVNTPMIKKYMDETD